MEVWRVGNPFPRCEVQHPRFHHINHKTKDAGAFVFAMNPWSFRFDVSTVQESRTALHVAGSLAFEAIAKHRDFNEVNAVDTFGYTLLILAASKGMSQVCHAILDRDDFVGINSQDKWGATALHWAADQDLAQVCEKILTHPEFVEGNRRARSPGGLGGVASVGRRSN
ncbi:unnamed protein product [Effrenium voratum]|uniref:Uncharacterized protein n=1 Tax=Effrenium voratum TaxID=2562239 RepID=A0AA36JF72_9DINO|nr:unnamed protein product [Effrenium voratum]